MTDIKCRTKSYSSLNISLLCNCSLWQHQIWQCWFTNTCQMWCHWEHSANSCVFRILSLKSPAVVKTHLVLEKNLQRVLCSASVSALLRLISHFLSVCLTCQKRYDQHQAMIKSAQTNTRKWHHNRIQVRLSLDVKTQRVKLHSTSPWTLRERGEKMHLWTEINRNESLHNGHLWGWQ